MKVINPPKGITLSTPKGFPYVCYQPSADLKTAMIFKLRFQGTPYSALPSLVVISEAMSFSDFKPVGSSYEDLIIRYILGKAEHMGKLLSGQAGAVEILKASNKIARDTRRGAGNILIVHLRDEADIRSTVHNHLGMFIIHVVDTPSLEGKLIVGFKSSDIDGAPIFVTNGDQSMYAFGGTAETPFYNKAFDL